MDRFSSREEEPDWNPGALRLGQSARVNGLPISANPYREAGMHPIDWLVRSWNAGWAVADMEILVGPDAEEGQNG